MVLNDIKKIAILGSGAMGHGIALVCSFAGIDVAMSDIKQEFLDRGIVKIRESLEYLVSKGKLMQEDMNAVLTRLKTTTKISEAVIGAQLVIEAVPEVMDIKKSVFKEVADNVPADTILATNTSTMSITEIGSSVKYPESFAGMHFFNPPNRMRLVELIYGGKTSDHTIELLYQLSKKIQKIPVKVLKDRPGFIVNRVNAPVRPLLSAILDEGRIRPDAIDSIMKKHGSPMGPFELMDYIGLDIVYNGMKYYEKALSPDWKPGKFLSERIERNELGMKSGRGIYDWSSGKADIDLSLETSEILSTDFTAIQLNEAVRVFKEGIAQSAADIDMALIAGLNATEGPFSLASGMDPEALAGSLNKLSTRYGLLILKPEPEIKNGSFKDMLNK